MQMSNKDNNIRKYNILVYGAEMVNIDFNEDIDTKNFKLVFEPYSTSKRFNDFDCVILFQGIFEEYKYSNASYTRSRLLHKYDKNELDKRNNELRLLMKNNGFVCFLLNRPFRDDEDGNTLTSTDLSKIGCNSRDISRYDLSNRTAGLNCKLNEFNNFIELHGGANSYFRFRDDDYITIAEKNNEIVGFILWEIFYYLPTLIPDHSYKEYFTLLADSLTSSYNKIVTSTPDWINDIKISNQIDLEERKKLLTEDINLIDKEIDSLSKYKMILAHDGDKLVKAVKNVLENGLNLTIDSNDVYKEDLKITDKDGNPEIFIEVKGTNKGIKREHVNQVDSHRERAELPNGFPGLLIINTNIKNARNVIEKDKEPPTEQIIHAAKNNVLIIRTLDLLNLLNMYLNKNIDTDEILEIFKTKHGWLKVTDKSYEVIVDQNKTK